MTPLTTHIFKDGDIVSIQYEEGDKGHVEFHVIPQRKAIASKYISNMGTLLKYERVLLKQRALTRAQEDSYSRIKDEQGRLVAMYEELLYGEGRERRAWRKKTIL